MDVVRATRDKAYEEMIERTLAVYRDALASGGEAGEDDGAGRRWGRVPRPCPVRTVG